MEHYSQQAAAVYLSKVFRTEISEGTLTYEDFAALIDNHFWFMFYT
jgi:hypothetical protein